MRAATGSQRMETKRGVTWALLGLLKTNHAAAFWIICKDLIDFLFFSRGLSAPCPRHVFLYNFILFYTHSQYACANIKLCESSSTTSTSTSSEEDRRSVEPFLRGEESRGGLDGKEEDRGSPVFIPSIWSTCDSHEHSHHKEPWWKLPPQRELSGSEAYVVEATHNEGSRPPREPTTHASLTIRPRTNCVSNLM